IHAEKEVVDKVQDSRTEVSLDKALKINPDVEIGDMVIVESTPKNFGRVAAQTARQVIQQRIREAEREAQFNYYVKQVGEIVSGVIQAIGPQGVTLGLELKAEGIMPRSQQIPREHFRVHDRVRALLLEVKMSNRGPSIILSRAHRDFLRRLLENEVPEIYHGLVEIRSISREPGQRSKVAVAALQPGVDPVGACVGIRGVRIQAIVRELNDEKIDVIEWNPDPAAYIAKSLSPARVTGVYLDESSKGPKTATVVVPEDQLSLAIGRDGQNARLAAKLTSWRIDIKSLIEATSDVLFKLENEPEYARFAEKESENIHQIENILAKKAEGRPVMPEEYKMMSMFVDRLERAVIQRRKRIKTEQKERFEAARETVPESAFEVPLLTLGLSTRFHDLLVDEGYATVGDLMVQNNLDQDVIRELKGIGPKAIEEIETALNAMLLLEEEKEQVEAEVVVQEPLEEVEEPESTEREEIPSEIVEEELREVVDTEAEPTETLEAEEVEDKVEEIPTEEEMLEPAEVVEEAEGEEAEVEEEKEEELPESLEDIFKLKPEMLDIDDEMYSEDIEYEEEFPETKTRKKKKKKPRKYVDVEYDPEQDVTIYKKRHKRGEEDWDEDWDY
ncbi:MAG: transcription termination factor NusA, partial [Anaerolineales bacterium]